MKCDQDPRSRAASCSGRDFLDLSPDHKHSMTINTADEQPRYENCYAANQVSTVKIRELRRN